MYFSGTKLKEYRWGHSNA